MFWLFRRPTPERTKRPQKGQNPPPRPKKEIKPWGKKERMLVAIILAITILAGFVSWMGSQDKATKFNFPKVPLEVPSTTIELEK